MGSLGDELSLGSMPTAIRSGFPIKASKIMAVDKSCKLEEHIKKLEEEKIKLESCKLELPLSLEIVNNAILYLKEENQRCLEMDTQPPLLKDFISNQRFSDTNIQNTTDIETSPEESSNGTKKVETGLGLGLTSSPTDNGGTKRIASCSFISNSLTQPQQPRPLPPQYIKQQALRKQRRCWTPELHRRFVDALQNLGGPGVATPKQIREHMQEEGLTNDEVKSHLQKYRLHIRKPNSKSEKQSAFVLGFNLWNSSQDEETRESSSKRSNSKSGSPQGPLQLASTTCGDSSMEDVEDA